MLCASAGIRQPIIAGNIKAVAITLTKILRQNIADDSIKTNDLLSSEPFGSVSRRMA